jgi:hypothetical protein
MGEFEEPSRGVDTYDVFNLAMELSGTAGLILLAFSAGYINGLHRALDVGEMLVVDSNAVSAVPLWAPVVFLLGAGLAIASTIWIIYRS